jgi:hypothetical protein
MIRTRTLRRRSDPKQGLALLDMPGELLWGQPSQIPHPLRISHPPRETHLGRLVLVLVPGDELEPGELGRELEGGSGEEGDVPRGTDVVKVFETLGEDVDLVVAVRGGDGGSGACHVVAVRENNSRRRSAIRRLRPKKCVFFSCKTYPINVASARSDCKKWREFRTDINLVNLTL